MKEYIIIIIMFIILICNKTYIDIKEKELNTANYKISAMIIENANLKNEVIKANLYADSIEEVKDSIKTKLFISNYKIERIKKYNRIAGKGNNIKYLRGWINRVVNE